MILWKDLEDSPQFDKSIQGELVKIGRQSEKEPFPILYLTEEMANERLIADILSAIEGKKWRWVKFAFIEKFAMTECALGSIVQRVVQPRYAGYCEIEVLDEPA